MANGKMIGKYHLILIMKNKLFMLIKIKQMKNTFKNDKNLQ